MTREDSQRLLATVLKRTFWGGLIVSAAAFAVGTALTDPETGGWVWEPKPPRVHWTDANRWEK